MRWGVGAATLLTMLMVPSPALAHPLGNFTTNQYVGLFISAERLVVDHITDMAEVPASQHKRQIDADGDEDLDDEELVSFRTSQCRAISEDLSVAVDGTVLPLAVEGSHLSFPEGEAGLDTLRLECRLTGPLSLDGPATLTVENLNFAERPGWREMTVATEGVAASSDLPSQSTTERLTSYPEELLSSPVDVRFAAIELRPQPGASAGSEPPPMGAAIERSTPVDALAGLIDPSAGSPAVPVAMGVALALGVVHALAPGHGKTVMAAYLVGSKGTLGQALGLGLAVAVSHTVGVLALGLVALIGTTAFAPERVLPVLSLASGLIVVGIGIWLLGRWWRHRRAHLAGGDHPHHHGNQSLEGRSGWKMLTAMGLSGGLVPSTSAVVLLLAAVNLERIPLGIMLILLFGLGMAATLVGVGFLLVKAGDLGMDRLGEAAWVAKARAVIAPAAAVVVIGVGVFLSVQALAA